MASPGFGEHRVTRQTSTIDINARLLPPIRVAVLTLAGAISVNGNGAIIAKRPRSLIGVVVPLPR